MNVYYTQHNHFLSRILQIRWYFGSLVSLHVKKVEENMQCN